MSFIAGFVPAPGTGKEAQHAFILRAAAAAQARGAGHFGFEDTGGGALVMGQTFSAGMAETPQPFRSADGACSLVFSGVLYNADTLRDRAASPTMDGGEIVLDLYRQKGEEAFARLAGAYSFCLWDGARRLLFVGHDGGGLGRLYVAQRADGIGFSSDAALVGVAPRDLGAGAIAQFLALGAVLPGGTVADGVWMVDPGGYLRIEDGRATRWNVAGAGLEPTVEAEGTLGPALARSLRGVLRLGQEPAGLLVSGGLYAGALAAVLGEVHGATRAVTIGLPLLNEFDCAGTLCEQAGVPLRNVEVPADALLESLDAVLAAIPTPVDAPQALLMALAVGSMDPEVKTLFTGIGARELFGEGCCDVVEPAAIRTLLRRPADLRETRTLDKWVRALPPGQPLPVRIPTLAIVERRAALVSAAAAARGIAAVHPFLANPALQPVANAVAVAAEAQGTSRRAALLDRLGIELAPVVLGREPSQPILYRHLLLTASREAVGAAIGGLHRTAADVIEVAEAERIAGRYYDGDTSLAPLVWRLYLLGRWLALHRA